MNAKLFIFSHSFEKNSIHPQKKIYDLLYKVDPTKTWSKYSGGVQLPIKYTRYTILRSPHVDKKSREQFETKIHKQLIYIYLNTESLKSFLVLLKQQGIAGTQLKIRVNYATRLKRSF